MRVVEFVPFRLTEIAEIFTIKINGKDVDEIAQRRHRKAPGQHGLKGALIRHAAPKEAEGDPHAAADQSDQRDKGHGKAQLLILVGA